jgi:hypothetical protein
MTFKDYSDLLLHYNYFSALSFNFHLGFLPGGQILVYILNATGTITTVETVFVDIISIRSILEMFQFFPSGCSIIQTLVTQPVVECSCKYQLQLQAESLKGRDRYEYVAVDRRLLLTLMLKK